MRLSDSRYCTNATFVFSVLFCIAGPLTASLVMAMDLIDSSDASEAVIDGLQHLGVSIARSSDNRWMSIGSLACSSTPSGGQDVLFQELLATSNLRRASVLLGKLEGLRELDISEARYAVDADIEELFTHVSVEKTVVLSIRGSGITDRIGKTIRRMKNLKGLHISDASVSSELCREIIQLKALKDLSLRNVLVADGIELIADKVPKLQALDLSDTDINDSSVSLMRHLGELSYLNVSGTSISDRAILHLRELKKLKRLVLSNTKITDECVRDIESLVRIEQLHVNGTHITEGGKSRIRSKIKTCVIVD